MPDGSLNSPPFPADRAFGVRRFGAVNWIGVWTLYKREVLRFLKVAFQTVCAPIITTLLYLTVFIAAFAGGRSSVISGVEIAYATFLPPGLIMMSLLGNAFQNSSSSLIVAKVQGSIVDVLMPPLSASELTVAYILGAATRGLLVALVTGVAIALFMALTDVSFVISNIFVVMYFGFIGAMMFGAIGTIAGMWAQKFDQLALITNFVITPLTFLSGTFFSVKRDGIPDWVADVSVFNPVFYLIDGFRSGFIGVADANVAIGAVVSFVIAAGLVGVVYGLFRRGYKLKS